jgi:hypothetical protein
MTKLAIALGVAILLYAALFLLLPITQETAVIIPWAGEFEWSFTGLLSTGVFAAIMGK